MTLYQCARHVRPRPDSAFRRGIVFGMYLTVSLWLLVLGVVLLVLS